MKNTSPTFLKMEKWKNICASLQHAYWIQVSDYNNFDKTENLLIYLLKKNKESIFLGILCKFKYPWYSILYRKETTLDWKMLVDYCVDVIDVVLWLVNSNYLVETAKQSNCNWIHWKRIANFGLSISNYHTLRRKQSYSKESPDLWCASYFTFHN